MNVDKRTIKTVQHVAKTAVWAVAVAAARQYFKDLETPDGKKIVLFTAAK